MGYRLKQLIGVGTFAEVWHAGPVDGEGNPCAADVALKIARCSLENDVTDRERAALYRILYLSAHFQLPGTVKILDISRRDDRMVIAMELADGNLLEVLQQSLVGSEYLGYIREAAATLDELHRRRVVHGGINPTDILIRDGHAEIGDFGPLPCDTSTSRIPYYKAVCMAPEVPKGEPRPESDQYALAATYAWLRLRHVGLQTCRGELPGRLNVSALPRPESDVLSTALDPNADKRFASCCAFAKALEEVLP